MIEGSTYDGKVEERLVALYREYDTSDDDTTYLEAAIAARGTTIDMILAAATTHEQPLSTMVQNSDASTSCGSQGSHRERPYEYMNRNHIS